MASVDYKIAFEDGRAYTPEEWEQQRQQQEAQQAKEKELAAAMAIFRASARAIDGQSKLLKHAAWEEYQIARTLILNKYRKPKHWRS
jgi:hypothetical protein